MFISRMWTSILPAVCRYKYNNVLWSNNHLEIRNYNKWNRWWLGGYNIEHSISLNECNRINSRSIYNRRKRKKIFNAEDAAGMRVFLVAGVIKHVLIKILSWRRIKIWKLLSFGVIDSLSCIFFSWDVINSLECKHRDIPDSFDSYRYCPSYINQLAK